jgi:hypothetical protein
VIARQYEILAENIERRAKPQPDQT